MNEFILRGKHVVFSDGSAGPGSIHVQGEKIAGVYRGNQTAPDFPVIDVGEKWIFPGVVDSHVHINEPGRTEWEGFLTATAAAAAGGVTTLVDMPLNSDPVTTTADAFQQKLDAAKGKLAVDVGFHAGLVPGNVPDLPDLIKMGVLGVKAFMVYSGIPEFLNVTEKDISTAMPLLARHGMPLLAHAEIDGPVELSSDDRRSYMRYLASRPSSWEIDAISILIDLCRNTKCPVHVVHLATADALPLLAAARAEGLPITVETCPHYLHFQAENIPDADTRFKCAPPIREAKHREALWAALSKGDIDMVATDHSPCPPDMKLIEQGDFVKAWGGISSLQLGLAVMITECRRRSIPLEHIAQWMSASTARLVGLYPRKGVIAPGSDADLVVVDPESTFIVKGAALRHRHKVTPYENETLYGVVETTYLRGRVVYNAQQEGCEYIGQILTRN